MEYQKKDVLKRDNGLVIEVPDDFKANRASKNAQCIHSYDELKVELWFDKHYYRRSAKGEREGIEIEGVQALIVKSFRYLLDIHFRIARFEFINYSNPNNKDSKKTRIILKDIKENGTLNVVAEIHYIESGMFEITAITAMEIDDFNVSDGQYVLCITSKHATLRRMVRKSLDAVYKLDL